MFEIIFLIILILSLGGVAVILSKKVPVLHTLPHHGNTGIKKHRLVLNAQNRVKGISKYFEKQIFMHKFLSWVKVMTLKVERRVDELLHKIRQKNKPE
jgi:hypothetical protein